MRDWSPKRCARGLMMLVILIARPLHAAEPSTEAILSSMKAALEPDKSSLRTMTFQVHSKAFNETTQIIVREARKKFPDGQRSVIEVMEPESLKGITMLFTERGRPHEWYMYFPAVRRTRTITGGGVFESFLETDFTYADLGLVEVQHRSFKLRGSETRAGTKVFKIEEKPKLGWYYSRIFTWIAADSGLPLERHYYDIANQLWRKEVYAEVTTVDEIPTPMHVRIDDVHSGDWSDYRVSDLRYDVQVPDDIFDPKKIREVAANPVWSMK